MQYGWLSTTFPGTQEDGFFIDEENRILFWPTKKSNGYVIGATAAQQILEDKKKWKSHFFPVIPFLIWIYFPELTYHALSRLVAIDPFSGFHDWIAFAAHLSIYAIPVTIWTEWKIRHAGAEHLRLSQVIYSQRPEIRYVSPVNAQSLRNRVFHFFVFLVTALMGPAAVIVIAYQSSYIWELIAGASFSMLFTYYWFLYMRRIVNATPKKDVWLYDISK